MALRASHIKVVKCSSAGEGGTVGIGVAVARFMTAVGAIPPTRLRVAELIALLVVKPIRQASIGASKLGADAVMVVPAACGVEAGFVAEAIAPP